MTINGKMNPGSIRPNAERVAFLTDELEKELAGYLAARQQNDKDVSDGVCIVAMTRVIRKLLEIAARDTGHDAALRHIKEQCALMFTTGMH